MASDPQRPRVVLDTNVVLSGIFFAGLPGRLLDAWQQGQLTLVLSPAILAEYQRAGAALAARYPDVIAPLEPILTLLARSATIVDAPPLGQPIAPDPDDDKFLACALAAGVSIIVTGDKPLLTLSGWAGLEILTPRQFFDRYLGGGATGDG